MQETLSKTAQADLRISCTNGGSTRAKKHMLETPQKIAQADLCTSCMNGGSTRAKESDLLVVAPWLFFGHKEVDNYLLES